MFYKSAFVSHGGSHASGEQLLISSASDVVLPAETPALCARRAGQDIARHRSHLGMPAGAVGEEERESWAVFVSATGALKKAPAFSCVR